MKTYSPNKFLFILLGLIAFIEIADFTLTYFFVEQSANTFVLIALSVLDLIVLTIGGIFCYQAIKHFQKHIEYQQRHNTQTGIPNRLYFIEKLEEYLTNPDNQEKPASIAVVRLDSFDDLSYILGHKTTDLVVSNICDILKTLLKPESFIAQLTSRSYVIFLPNCPYEQAYENAKNIIDRFNNPILVENEHLDIHIHVGLSHSEKDGRNAAQLVQKAAIARYISEDSYHRFASYDPKKDPHQKEKLSLMGDLLRGLEENQFMLYYQPKINAKTLKTTGVETLIRWQHPKYGFMPPDNFITLAEKTGYIHDLTIWVIRNAMIQGKSWLDKNPDFSISINLSPENIMNDKVISSIPYNLQKYDIDPKNICCEITETAVLKDPAPAIKIIQDLSETGVRFALDDFGTGYSSLEYLKQLPISELKIDKTFVLNMDTDKDDAAIVSGTTKLAHDLGMKLVAEGVENEASVNMMREMGVDLFQGYYFSKPLPYKEFKEFLATSKWGF